MATLALVSAFSAVLVVAIPGVGKYLAMGLGVMAIAAGIVTWRRRTTRGGARLAGAAAVALGVLGLVLGAAKVALTLMAVERLGQILGGS